MDFLAYFLALKKGGGGGGGSNFYTVVASEADFTPGEADSIYDSTIITYSVSAEEGS